MYKVKPLLIITRMGKSKNQLRKAKYADMSAPKATLDFHEFGPMQSKEIVSKVRDFIAESVRSNLGRVLIITGKGTHSKNGISVVKPTVERSLRGMDEVVSFSNARRDRGGDGAIEVVLS